MAVDVIETNLDGTGLSIGVVVSRFNEYAGKELYAACLAELKRLGVMEEDITYVTVPGALEIPFALSRLADTGDYDALIGMDCAQCAVEMARLAEKFPSDFADYDEDDDNDR